ncbi:MAG: hypothetical protein QXO14_06150 [Desulfurococcaceae archaeon]
MSRENLMKMFMRNLNNFLKLLEFSCKRGYIVFRLGSNFIPFASYEKFDKEWLSEIDAGSKRIAPILREYGVEVINWILGKESIAVVHVGGVYGDKMESLKRFVRIINGNDWLVKRLAIENDERYYSVRDVIDIGEEIGIPVVFDYYRHMLNQSDFDMDRLLDT